VFIRSNVNRRSLSFAIAFSSLALTTGCTGGIRETTTPRTATEQLLVSTSAERALLKFQPKIATPKYQGKRVAIDDTKFESLHKAYVVSGLKNLLSRNQIKVVPLAKKKYRVKGGKEVELGPQYVIEIRSAALGIKDSDFGIGIPSLPIPIPQTALTSFAPSLYLFNRNKQEGWAKFQFWIYEPVTDVYIDQSEPLWGKAYYTLWTIFAVGPFDFSQDIYPDEDLMEVFK
jgi:hypothetical protein